MITSLMRKYFGGGESMPGMMVAPGEIYLQEKRWPHPHPLLGNHRCSVEQYWRLGRNIRHSITHCIWTRRNQSHCHVHRTSLKMSVQQHPAKIISAICKVRVTITGYPSSPANRLRLHRSFTVMWVLRAPVMRNCNQGNCTLFEIMNWKGEW